MVATQSEVSGSIRSLNARANALLMHSMGLTNTGPARQAFHDKFEKIVDPEGKLPADVRARRAEQARKAHFLRMAAASAKVRSAKARAS